MKKAIQTTFYILISTALTFSLAGCKSDNSPWIWKIAGKKYTVNDLETAYENYIFLLAQQLSVTPEQLRSFIDDPSMLDDPRMREYVMNLSLKNYAETYKQLILMNEEAEKQGFLKRDDVKSKMEFFQKFYVANLYMTETVQGDPADISQDEALQAWEIMKKRNPQYRQVPLDEGISAARQQLQMAKAMEKQQELVKSVVESYTIEPNPDFKLSDYVKQKKNSDTKPEGEGEQEPESTENH